MVVCYIGIGSNLGDPVEKAKQAIAALAQLKRSNLVATSSLYSSKPMGPKAQPDYINAVAKLTTELAPLELLDQLQHIEQHSGRVRKDERWGPRTLDLDILLIDDLIIEEPRLTVPHYGMHLREFVLYPLYEIAPELTLPNNVTLKHLVDNCPRNGLDIYTNA
jgi:2-amino-4-hydroxy-6-hydroxymethyldihydropteridine diphosphokinase